MSKCGTRIMDSKDVLHVRQIEFTPSDNAAYTFYEGGLVQTLSYGQLKKQCSHIQNIIHDIVSELEYDVNIVAIHCEAVPNAVCCILGVLMAGYAFTFISNEITDAEKISLVSDIKPDLLLAETELRCSFSEYTVVSKFRFQVLHSDFVVLSRYNFVNSKLWCVLPKLCYVISTSGTTGIPKVVYVPDQCIGPNIKDLTVTFDVQTCDVIFSASPLTFDPSYVDLFVAVSVPCHILSVSSSVLRRPSLLLDILEREGVTIIQATPSLISNLLSSGDLRRLSKLRIISLGGEQLSSQLVNRIKSLSSNIIIFNFYGLTEVSCWATVQKIEEKTTYECVPIGTPLSQTLVEVVDDSGKVVEEGQGQISVGGRKRQCWLSCDIQNYVQQLISKGDVNMDDVKMQVTGDIGLIKNNLLYCQGRKDSIVKRNGIRISLAEIDCISQKIPGISYSLSLHSELHGIVLFIVVKKICTLKEDDVFKFLKRFIAPWKLPNRIIIVSSLIINKHGKVDKSKMLQLCLSQSVESENLNLEFLWCKYTNAVDIKSSDNFILLGGTSITALAFAEDVYKQLKVVIPDLVDVLLHKTFADVKEGIMQNYSAGNLPVVHTDKSDNCKVCKVSDTPSPGVKTSEICSYTSTQGNFRHGMKIRNIIENPLSLKCIWKYNLDKCIDASPLCISWLVESLILIGSHSHKFACVNSESGSERWCISLGDRIQSSAAVSTDFKCAYVGCYDGYMYCISIANGFVLWKHKTGAEIKSSPIVDVSTGNVIFGSHDKHLYSVSNTGHLQWKIKLSNGSIYSTSCVHLSNIYVGTLDGYIVAVDKLSGNLAWKQLLPLPIFSSVSICSSAVVFGCVDGSLYSFSLSGEFLWNFQTDGPIFSSPFILDIDGNSIIGFGSHDGFVYFLDENGHLLTKFEGTSPFYGTPYLTLISDTNDIVCVISEISGALRVLLISIQPQPSVKVLHCSMQAGECFSSAIVNQGKVYLGCRDNYLYCFSLMNDELKQ